MTQSEIKECREKHKMFREWSTALIHPPKKRWCYCEACGREWIEILNKENEMWEEKGNEV